MSKRESGEGTYYTEGDLFCWRLRDRNGRIVATVKRKTAALRKSAVKIKLHEIEAAGGHVLSRQRAYTVGSWLQWWLENIVRRKSALTYRQHEQAARLYITPHLGTIQLTKLTSRDGHEWQAALSRARKANGEPYSARTRGMALCTLRAALNAALAQVPPLIMVNPVASIEEPKADAVRKRTLRPDAMAKVIAQVDTSRYGPMVSLLLATGASVSEAGGWKWSDYDKTADPRPVLLILRKLEWESAPKDANGKRTGAASWTFEDVKRKKRRRAVPLGAQATEALAKIRAEQDEHKAKLGKYWPDHDLILTAETGEPIKPRNLQRGLDIILSAAGVPHIGLHDLRKTYGSQLARSGVGVHAVMTLLGHSNIATAEKHYIEVLTEDAAAAAAVFD